MTFCAMIYAKRIICIFSDGILNALITINSDNQPDEFDILSDEGEWLCHYWSLGF